MLYHTEPLIEQRGRCTAQQVVAINEALRTRYPAIWDEIQCGEVVQAGEDTFYVCTNFIRDCVKVQPLQWHDAGDADTSNAKARLPVTIHDFEALNALKLMPGIVQLVPEMCITEDGNMYFVYSSPSIFDEDGVHSTMICRGSNREASCARREACLAGVPAELEDEIIENVKTAYEDAYNKTLEEAADPYNAWDVCAKAGRRAARGSIAAAIEQLANEGKLGEPRSSVQNSDSENEGKYEQEEQWLNFQTEESLQAMEADEFFFISLKDVTEPWEHSVEGAAADSVSTTKFRGRQLSVPTSYYEFYKSNTQHLENYFDDFVAIRPASKEAWQVILCI